MKWNWTGDGRILPINQRDFSENLLNCLQTIFGWGDKIFINCQWNPDTHADDPCQEENAAHKAPVSHPQFSSWKKEWIITIWFKICHTPKWKVKDIPSKEEKMNKLKRESNFHQESIFSIFSWHRQEDIERNVRPSNKRISSHPHSGLLMLVSTFSETWVHSEVALMICQAKQRTPNSFVLY